MVKKGQRESCEKVRMSGKKKKGVDKFKYLVMIITVGGEIGEEVAHRVLEGRMVWGTKAKFWKNLICRELKRELYNRVVIPTKVYGSKMWPLSAEDKRRIEVLEMMCLRSICGIRRRRDLE